MTKPKIAGSARIIGQVRLGSKAYIAQGSILRSVEDSITLGNGTWVLENSVLIGTPEQKLSVGSKTIFGHRCVAIGAEIGSLCEIGNSTIFLPGSKVGNWCIFGEGTIVPAGQVIPSESVVVGRPGRVIRRLTSQDRERIASLRGNDTSLGTPVEHISKSEGKEGDGMQNLYEYNGKFPSVSASTVVFPSAEITGDVVIGENCVIGAGVKIIGDSHGPVRIGNNVHILENTVLHLLPDNELNIHDNVTIGPCCMIHGTTIGANSVIEAGAIVCDYSTLGKNTLVKAGSLVKQRSVFPDNQILEGFPAKSSGELTELQPRPVWAFR
jgi:carbonic anhydrase/acetyltransferase-like protein (isoleucine patch superfamily)